MHYRILSSSLKLAGHGATTEQALEELLLYARPFPQNRLPYWERIYRGLLQVGPMRGIVLAAKRSYTRLQRRDRA